jgi:hypothetical protein
MRYLGLAAAALAVGTGVLYVGLLIRQGSPVPPLTVAIVTSAIGALAVLTTYGSFGRDPDRRALALWAAIPGFFSLGYLAAFTIGGLLLIGGILTLPVAIRALRGISPDRGTVAGWALVVSLAWSSTIAALLLAASWRPDF